jgi:hypothetical protein
MLQILVCQHFAHPVDIHSICVIAGIGRNVIDDDSVEIDFIEYEFETPFDLAVVISTLFRF